MAVAAESVARRDRSARSLVLSRRDRWARRVGALAGESVLFAVTALSLLAVVFLLYYVARDALPFFRLRGIREFFASTHWYPSAAQPEFGALAMFAGSGVVTLGAAIVAVPLGVAAAVCLSDVLPFALRQWLKPVIEMLAAIPSVAYGFFALVIFAPLLQRQGGAMLEVAAWVVGAPAAALAVLVAGEVAADRFPDRARRAVRWALSAALGGGAAWLLLRTGRALGALEIASGTNALNVAIVLGVMAIPTVASVSEDALQAVGRELREGSYALGATRAETLLRTVLPAAGSGILAAVILGIMRAVGETMVVWMASGNAAQIPKPWYNVLQPVRTLTATIAGDMGEADQVTGSARYHVLFALALCLLAFSFLCNLSSEWIVRRARTRTGG